MKIIKTFKADEQERDKLQYYSIEVESRQNLLAFMLNNDMFNNDGFKRYQEEYTAFYREYVEAKNAFQRKNVNPILEQNNIDANIANWNLDFHTCECTISISE